MRAAGERSNTDHTEKLRRAHEEVERYKTEAHEGERYKNEDLAALLDEVEEDEARPEGVPKSKINTNYMVGNARKRQLNFQYKGLGSFLSMPK